MNRLEVLAMKKLKLLIIITTMILTTFINPVSADYELDRPEPPEIEWDDDYSNGSSSQRVRMTAYVPDDAEKIKFVLIADDDVKSTTRTVSSSDEITCTFTSLDEEQEVWGYIIAYDEDGYTSERSELASEYIEKKSSTSTRVDVPEDIEIEWENPYNNTKNKQKVTITAEMPDDAEKLQYFLVCDGTLKDSNETTKESYTFSNVDYDQVVYAYVKAYDDDGYESEQSPTTMIYIGDDGDVSTPDKPYMQFIDMGYNYPYGQQILVKSEIPDDAKKVEYFLIANGQVLSSGKTDKKSYTFNYINDNQIVYSFVRAYDWSGNESSDSERSALSIPNRTNTTETSGNQTNTEELQELTGRITDSKKGISMRGIELPTLWISASFHFEDISKEDKELEEALQYLYSTRLLENRYTKKFYPNGTMSRIDFLNLLLKASNISDDRLPKLTSHFEDINNDYLYHDEVLLANYNGIMRGYSDYKFKPNNSITYGTATRAIVKAFDIRYYNYQGERLIDDIGEHYINALVDAKLMSKPMSQFNYISRGDAVKLIYKIIKMKMENR